MQLQGLRKDGKFADSAPITWSHAKNILISRGFDEVENEPGDIIFNDDIVGSIVGRITTPSEIILFILNNTNVYIKHLSKTGTLSSVLTTTTPYMNLSLAGIFIEGVYCYTADGDLVIAWTNGATKPMILNVTQALAEEIVIESLDDLKPYYLFPEFDHNNISLPPTAAIINGGRLPAAAYFISLAYEIEPNVNTNFGLISNPIFITKDDSLTSYKQFRGNGSAVITSKALLINITDIDTQYDYFKLAVIQKTETGSDCFITKRIKRSATTVTVLIDDLSNLVPFPISEVVVSSPAYNKVQSVTQSNKRLRLLNCSKVEKLPLATIYEDVISKFSVNWVNDNVVSLNETKGSYKDSVFIFNNRTFRSDEVYALYAGLRLKTGGFYGIYHLPGNPYTDYATDPETVTVASTIDNVQYRPYQVGSTATKIGNYYGKMGYWANENETYPDEYGATLRGKNVRHHRFPSAGQLNTWKTGLLHTNKKGSIVNNLSFSVGSYLETGNTYRGTLTPSSVPSLGTFTVAAITNGNVNKYTALYNQVLTLELDITAMVATYTGVTGSLQLTVTKYTKVGTTYTSAVVNPDQHSHGNTTPDSINFTFSSDIELLTGDYITINIIALSEGPYEGFTPSIESANPNHIHVYEAAIGQEILGLRIGLDWNTVPTSTKNELESIIDGWEIFYAKRTLNNQLMIDQSIAILDGTGYRFYGFDSMVNLLNIEPTHVKSEGYVGDTDFSNGAYVNEVLNYTGETARISEISKIKYLPAYNSATIPNNENKENCYYFETLSNSFHKRLVNLINIKTDLYLDFSSQELVSTGVVKPLQQTSPFSLYGGDTYIGHNSVLTFPTGDIITPRIWYFPIESILNSGMRYEGDNDYEKFFPLTDITSIITEGGTDIQSYITAMKEAGIANYYFYNKDYHILNTFRQDSIDNELTSLNNNYPHRIHSSMPQPSDSNSIHWKKFKPMDYFDMKNTKGVGYKMLGNDYIVYIQTEFSIFRGIIVDKLVTGNIDVALKSAEMFDRPLEELLDADGTYIKPWNKEGMILTPYGLVVADLDKGSIYVISDKANEITKLGIEDWFRKTVTKTMTFGTKESIGSGVILGYDDIYKRLLVTIKNNNTSIISPFTLSFQLEKMQWVCFHDYTPDKYIWNANGMYSISGVNIHKLFTNNFGIYNGFYYPSSVDFIFNNNKGERFLLKSVNWVTNIEKDGVNYWDETISKLLVYSKNQCSDEIDITKEHHDYDSITFGLKQEGNTLFYDGTWINNDIKDYLRTPNSVFLDNDKKIITSALNLLKEYFEKSLIIGKFVIVRLTFTNTDANKKCRISNVGIDIKGVL